MQECNICLETCKVPIQLTHFECYNPMKVNCNSFIRFCLSCYIKNKDKLSKNCLICKKGTTRPDHYPVIDSNYMYHDEFSRYKCDLCHDINNDIKYFNHLDLYNHIMTNHIYTCQECDELILHNSIDKHHCKKKDTKKSYQCIECHQLVGEDDVLKHYLSHLNETSSQIEIFEERTRVSKKLYKKLLKESERIYNLLFPMAR